MKSSLQAGVACNATISIDRERTIDFMGEKARVYATPMLVRDIEVTCRNLLMAHLDGGEDSVGTRVELDHTGATLMGMMVELQVRITEVQGRSITFDVTGSDGIDAICRCRHQRFVVDVAKTEQRLAAKALKAGLA
jgi:fluoroacetyl-CoA thioesterase